MLSFELKQKPIYTKADRVLGKTAIAVCLKQDGLEPKNIPFRV